MNADLSTFVADAVPSLNGHPLLAMLTIMGLWVGTLLCLQWLWSLIEAMHEDPAPLRHPLTATRSIKLCFILASLACAVPRLVLLMAWPVLSPSTRAMLGMGSWLVFAIWAVMLASAWWIDRNSAAVTRYQLRRAPCPAVPIPRANEKMQGALILGLIFVVAFATTYVRPSDARSVAYERR